MSVRSSKSFGKRMKNVMGWNIDDQAKSLLESNGKMKLEELTMFWLEIQGNEEKYFVILLDRFYEFFENKPAEYSIEAVVRTMVFLLLVYDLRYMRSNVKAKLDISDKPFYSIVSPAVKGMFNDMKNFFANFSPECAIMFPAINYDDHKDSDRIEKWCYDYYLRTHNNEGLQTRTNSAVALIDELETLKNFEAKKCAQIEIRLQHALVVFRDILSHHECLVPKLLRIAEKAIEPFVYWPVSVSKQYFDLAMSVKAELLIPGYAMLRKFFSESFFLSLKMNVPIVQKNKVESVKMLRVKPLYYVYDKTCDKSVYFAKLMKISDLPFEEFEKLKMRKGMPTKIAFTALSYMIEKFAGINEKDITNMKWLTSKNVKEYLNESIDLVHACLEMKKTFEWLEGNFKNLKMKIYETAVDNINNPSSSLKTVPQIEKFPQKFVPPMPYYNHLFISTHTIPEENTRESVSFIISELYKRHFNLYMGIPSRIRVILFGGEAILNCAMKEYSEIFRVPETFDLLKKRIEFEFYLVPVIDSGVSEYIASSDPFYERNVKNPFRNDLFIPSFDFTEDVKSFNEKRVEELLKMGHVYRELIEDFVQKAEYDMEILLFEIKVWKSETSLDSSCDETLSFSGNTDIEIKGNLVMESKLTGKKIDVKNQRKSELKINSGSLSSIQLLRYSQEWYKNIGVTPFDSLFGITVNIGDKKMKIRMSEMEFVCGSTFDLKSETLLRTNLKKLSVSPIYVKSSFGKIESLKMPLKVFRQY